MAMLGLMRQGGVAKGGVWPEEETGGETASRKRVNRPRKLGCEMKLLRMMPEMPSQRRGAYRYAVPPYTG
jgi:hypothetical protein